MWWNGKFRVANNPRLQKIINRRGLLLSQKVDHRCPAKSKGENNG